MPATALTCKAVRRTASGTCAAAEQAPGLRLAIALGRIEPDVCGRDVEVAEIQAAEGARCGLRHRQTDDTFEPAVGRVTVNSPATPERDPHAALGVKRQAVRDTLVRRNACEGAPVRDGAVRSIEVEQIDRMRGTVNEIHAAIVVAPI